MGKHGAVNLDDHDLRAAQVHEQLAFGLSAKDEYVRHIVTGLRDHSVPDDYIATVKRIAAENSPDLRDEFNVL